MNKYSLHIYPKAAEDMQSIFKYLSEELHNPTAAVNLIDQFEKALDTVCFAPSSCPQIQNEFVRQPLLRKLIVKNYIIFYLPNEKAEQIEVVRVLYGMMNFKALL